ncbi:MAG: hypothetical protein ACYDBB_04900 [Armatimonadota bacterium]
MMSRISLFSGYNTSENRTTNYCLLLLKMVYEENPKLLADVLSSLVGENISENVGVKFLQQQKASKSVLDGVIVQEAFTIFIETKHFDWFYDNQLTRHLAALHKQHGVKMLIALSNFEMSDSGRFSKIEQLCQAKYRGSIFFAAVNFEDLLQALMALPPLPKNLSDAIADFRDYLDEQELLPSWQHTLDVINCAGIPEEIIEGNVYMCPAEGGAYNHRRCRFFGMYKNKTVQYVAEIEAVVDLEADGVSTLKWRHISKPNKDLIAQATSIHRQWRPNEYPTRVFVLGKLYPTHFIKDTSGGMLGSKQYFDISTLNVTSAEELAEQLRDLSWSQLNA